MARGLLVAFTTPAEGREDEFNKWYDEVHVPELLALPGFKSATRYKIADQQLAGGEPPGPYLALYELEGDDLADAVAGIRRGFEEGSVTRSDAAAPGKGSLLVFEEVLSRQES